MFYMLQFGRKDSDLENGPPLAPTSARPSHGLELDLQLELRRWREYTGAGVDLSNMPVIQTITVA
jgi:hypothetical protein